MTKNQVANWAVKAGINIYTGFYKFVCSQTIEILFRFAQLVEKAAVEKERKACAKLCEKLLSHDCAEAIRARGQK